VRNHQVQQRQHQGADPGERARQGRLHRPVVISSCNEYIMELLIMTDAIRHAKADSVTAVLPYYPYVRSDKKDEPRISITARLSPTS